jgi:hypothetical protein
MATTRSRKKIDKRRSRLMSGYDSLTLDPSPRLRHLWEEMFPPSETVLENAWKHVGSALLSAMKTTSRALRDSQKS